MINVTIGGVQYKSLGDSFQARQELTYKVDSCRLNIRTMTKPADYSEIIVTDGTNKKFAGVVIGSTLIDDANGIWQVMGYDYSKAMDSKLVVEEYTAQSASDIVLDIITKYVDPSFDDSGVLSGAPTIDFIQFNYVKVSDAIKKLCDRVGWQWYVDYDKVIRFFNAEDTLTPAPEEITAITQVFGLEFDADVSDLRNRVYALGGKYLSDPYTYEIKADGVSDAWVLPHMPFNISMEVNEVTQTIGIENVDNPASFQFLYNAKERRVTRSTGTRPADGLTISWVYQYEIDIVTVAEDLASQAAIAAIQGGDGVYEDRVADETLVTIESVEALAQSVINQYSNPYITGSYITRVDGYVTGQLVRINLPALGIDNTYMVQMVETFYRYGIWEYAIHFGGKLIGVQDYLQALISNQQSAVDVNTEILQKYIYVNEVALLADELTVTTRADDDPWYVEESYKAKLSNSSVTFNSVGSLMIATVNGTTSGLKYRFNAGTWVDWRHNVLADVPHPCSIEVSTAGIADVRNWKEPYTETDVITGEVIVIG